MEVFIMDFKYNGDTIYYVGLENGKKYIKLDKFSDLIDLGDYEPDIIEEFMDEDIDMDNLEDILAYKIVLYDDTKHDLSEITCLERYERFEVEQDWFDDEIFVTEERYQKIIDELKNLSPQYLPIEEVTDDTPVGWYIDCEAEN